MEISDRPRRALVCEDDHAIRSMLGTLLKREQFLVDSAADGREALSLITENPYDLLVIDLMMPQVGGKELITFLQQNYPKTLKRIIVTTAAPLERLPLPGDVCVVLPKPFDNEDFLRHANSCSEDTLTRERRVNPIPA